MFRKLAFLLAVLCIGMVPVANAAGLVATPASTTVTYASAESLTISVDTSTLALSTTQQTIHTTTTWSLTSGRTAVQVIASFNVGAGAALNGTNAGDTILSSNVLGQGLSAEQNCDSPVPVGSYFASVGYGPVCDLVQNTAITSANMSGTSTNPFKIRISPSAVVTPDPGYTGTLFFFAAAM